MAAKRKSRKSSRKIIAGKSNTGFHIFAMHANEPADSKAFNALRTTRSTFPGFAIAESVGIKNLDPETVARQYVQQALASDAVPSFTTPEGNSGRSDFKSLGTETLPLTNTTTVKFRQTYNEIPVYSSLITVELDDNKECLAMNSALGTPAGVSPVAKVSPAEAVRKAIKLAGRQPEKELTPRLNYYFDKGARRWRLVYIIEDVPIKSPKKGREELKSVPFLMDYFIDAHTGAIVAKLPRTATMAWEGEDSLDGLNKKRRIRYSQQRGRKVLVDEQLNVATYNFNYRDPGVQRSALPGSLVTNPPVPWAGEAISAHANATGCCRVPTKCAQAQQH